MMRNAAVAIIIALGMVLLYYGQTVLLPVILAVLITYALDPFVRRLTSLRVPQSLAAMVTILALYGAVGFGAYSLRNRAMNVVASLPAASQKLQAVIQKGRGNARAPTPVNKLQEAVKEIEKTATTVTGEQPTREGVTRVQVDPPPFNLQRFLWSGTTGFLGLIGQGVVLTFLVYFLLASGDLYKRKIVRLVGSKLWQKRITVEALQEINKQIERFLLVQIFTSIVVALATWLLLVLMGVENAAVWAVAAGVLNSVPYFGAIVVSGGLALVTFLQFGTLLTTIEVAGGAFIITSLEGMLLTPALMGKAAGINQVAMFVSLLFWGWMWGVIGTLLAVPMMMIVKTICERVEGLQGFGELLNER